MKKSNWIAMMLCFLLLTGCAAKPKSFDEMTAEEQIEAATDYKGIMACVKASKKKSSNYTAENEDALFEKIKTYLFTEGTLNGTYYYNGHVSYATQISGTYLFESHYEPVSYTIVVYCVSPDEIYLVPKEKAPANMQDIPSMSNAASYKYQAARSEWGLGRSNSDEEYLNFVLRRYQGNNTELRIRYYEESKLLEINDKLPQQYGEWPSSQEYYADLSTSYSASRAEYDEHEAWSNEWDAKKKAEKEEQEKLAKSDPKVGMTKTEVEGCAWGKPDRKNIDEYSWGTSEQWVYKSKGYVYFKNGIVSSVSKR